MKGLSWGDVADIWKGIWTQFDEWARTMFDGLLTWLTVTLPAKVLESFQGMVNSAIQLVNKIPFVSIEGGDADGDDNSDNTRQPRGPGGAAGAAAVLGSLGNVASGIRIPSFQRPSAGATRTINQSRALQNTVNNVSRSAGNVMANVTNNITQRDGESGEALGRRIQGEFQKEMAKAIRDNDTGIER